MIVGSRYQYEVKAYQGICPKQHNDNVYIIHEQLKYFHSGQKNQVFSRSQSPCIFQVVASLSIRVFLHEIYVAKLYSKDVQDTIDVAIYGAHKQTQHKTTVDVAAKSSGPFIFTTILGAIFFFYGGVVSYECSHEDTYTQNGDTSYTRSHESDQKRNKCCKCKQTFCES